jgi:hypothetical protein
MRKNIFFILLLMIVAGTAANAQTSIKIGSPVLAYWEETQLYYVGTVVEKDNTVKGGGYLVIFADGDQAVVPGVRVRELDVKEGTKVLAMWSDKSYYPGTVAKIVGNALFINFDDGDEEWTSWAGIAVKPD